MQRDLYRWLALGAGLVLATSILAVGSAASAVNQARATAEATAQLYAVDLAEHVVVPPSLPAPETLDAALAKTGKNYGGIDRVALLQSTAQPGQLQLVAEWASDGAARPAGTFIDGATNDALVHGLRERTVAGAGDAVSAYAPVLDAQGMGTGVVVIDFHSDVVRSTRREAAALAMLLIAFTLGGVAALLWKLSRQPVAVISPISAVATDPGPLGRRIDTLTKSMHEREYIRQTFGRYVSHRVAEALVAEHDTLGARGEVVEVTVVRGELQSATLVAGHSEPAEVIAFLNEYIGAMSDAIEAQGGALLEYGNDGFVAIFGAPVYEPDHAARAVRCVQVMKRQIDTLHREWEKTGRARLWQSQGVPALQLHVGVDTGAAIGGNVGHATRMKYTVVGQLVDRVAVVTQAAAELGVGVAVSAEVIKRLPAGMVQAEDRGEHHGQRIYSI